MPHHWNTRVRLRPSPDALLPLRVLALRGGGQIEGLTVYRSLAEIPVAHLDRISVYLPPPLLLKTLPEIAAKGCDELWLNPGCESDEVVAQATAMGLKPILDCSIVELGVSPAQFSD